MYHGSFEKLSKVLGLLLLFVSFFNMYPKTAERTITMTIKPKSANITDSGMTISGVIVVKIYVSVIFSVDIVVEVVVTVKVVVKVFVVVFHIGTMEASVAYDVPIVE